MSLQVFIKREGDKMSLIVDGISSQSKRVPGGDRTRVTGPLYVGGVPPSLMVKHRDYTLTKKGSFIMSELSFTCRAAPGVTSLLLSDYNKIKITTLIF